MAEPAHADIVKQGKVAAIDESFETLHKAGKCYEIPHSLFVQHFGDYYNQDHFIYAVDIKDENYESGTSDSDE